jgi:peptidyl-prolyl cis-trans isomerase D
MLQAIHDKLHGWVAYVALAGIGGSFIFWGINWTLADPNYAVKVNGREIPVNDVREAYQRQLAQLQRQSDTTLSDAQREDLKREVLDGFIHDEALQTRVESLGYRVRDEDLLKAMAQIQAFQIDGKFDMAYAIAMLKAQGRPISDVEKLLRRKLQLEQLDAAMRTTTFVTSSELKRLEGLTLQQRELAWLVVPAAHFAAEAVPDDAAITAYYEAHKSEYMTPETVDVRYVEIDLDALEKQVPVGDDALKAFYEDQKAKNPDSFGEPEQRRISQILIPATDPKDDAAAKAQAETLLKRAQAGEDFAKLAKEFSQDASSAQKGGDLGWLKRKTLAPNAESALTPIADAAFAMKVGDVSGPIKTQFGYHILKLAGIQDATVKTFEQARSDLEVEYRRNEAERRFNELQDQLADAALQNSTDIDAVAKKAGLSVVTIEHFTRGEGGGALLKQPKAIAAAFSPEVLDGQVSPIIELDKGHGIVMKVGNHRMPQQEPLAQVRDNVVAAWKKQRGEQLAVEAAAGAASRLAAGESWEAVAKGLAVPLQAARFVSRGEQNVPAEVRRVAFELPKPAADKPEYRSVPLQDGDAAVFALTAVRVDPSTTPEEQAMAQRQFAQLVAASESESYALAARADAKVVVNPKAIE